jgi:hypothetical protein
MSPAQGFAGQHCGSGGDGEQHLRLISKHGGSAVNWKRKATQLQLSMRGGSQRLSIALGQHWVDFDLLGFGFIQSQCVDGRLQLIVFEIE